MTPPAGVPGQGRRTRVGIVSTWLPQRCGIATFSGDLRAALMAADPATDVIGVALRDGHAEHAYPPEVQFEIAQPQLADYRSAADFLNLREPDIVCLQHEFGIYGGESGAYALRLLQNLRMPVVSVFHTVLDKPSPEQKANLTRIAELSDRVVVMGVTAQDFLHRVYGVPLDHIAVIPHGVPDVAFLDPSYHKDRFGLVGRKVLLTFGLLSRGKGLEYVIEALPEIVKAHPDALFVAAGQTHPAVKRHEGESYRESLATRAGELGVAGHVRFIDEFLDTPTLVDLISTADICVTPYLGRDQIVSGVLSYALGAGKAIISTPYWYAEELLADGRGRIVPFRDAPAIASEAIALLSHDEERQAMRKRAYLHGREMVWTEVGARYHQVFADIRDDRIARRATVRADRREPQAGDLPLAHLHVLTDDTGILQHARYAVPDRDHGYCTDDNARALIVALMARNVARETDPLLDLAARYLSFLGHAFNAKEGRFRNFMSYDRRWLEEAGSEDSHGRALWALGVAVLEPTRFVGPALRLFDKALPAMRDITALRATCFALLGLDAYLRRFGGASEARRMRALLAARIYDRRGDGPDWPWPEEALSYANAAIPHALIASGSRMEDRGMLDAGLAALRWLVDLQTDGRGHLAPIGNDGWFVRGGSPARFDQQPLEAQHLIEALVEAYHATGDKAWLADAERCFGWFLGDNDLGQPVADLATGGCRDGIGPKGVNQNQGAESTLAFLHSLVRLRLVSRLPVAAAKAESSIRFVPPPAARKVRTVGDARGEQQGAML